jgi:hypothetical protein
MIPSPAEAQDFDREVAFLLIPVGARVVGMGRAATALGGEFQSAQWNPAVVGSIADVAPLVSHYSGPLDFQVNVFAAAVPVSPLGVVAVSAQIQSFGEIELSGAGSPDESLGSIVPSNLILSFGIGRAITEGLELGLAAKWIRSELIGDLEGSTYAFDAGAIWRPSTQVPLSLGTDGAGEPDPLPSRIRLGAAYDVLAHLSPDAGIGLLLAADLEHALRDLGTGSQYLGAELGLRDVLFVRGGLIAETLIETNTGVTLGAGLQLGQFRIDLAWELGVNQLGDETHLSGSARL